MKECYVKHLDRTTSKKLLELAKKENFVWVNNVEMDIDKVLSDFNKHFHKNSKLLFHFYFNSINKKYEIQMTTRTIQKTYPHSKIDKKYVHYTLDTGFSILKNLI